MKKIIKICLPFDRSESNEYFHNSEKCGNDNEHMFLVTLVLCDTSSVYKHIK